MRYELTKHVRKHKENGGFPKENRVERNGAVPKAEKDLDKVVCLICQKDCGEEGLDAHMASHDVKPLKCECTRLFYGKREYKKHLRGGCEVIGKDLELVGQKRVKREARIKKELKKESDG